MDPPNPDSHVASFSFEESEMLPLQLKEKNVGFFMVDWWLKQPI